MISKTILKKLSGFEKLSQRHARHLLPSDLKRILRSLNLPVFLRPYSCALSSFPRSGNTWVRLILEELGLRTGSIYKSDGVHSRSLRGDVIKTHSLDTLMYKKAILLVRNPFSTIASYWTYSKYTPSDLGMLPQFAIATFEQWFDHLECWHSFNGELLIVQYENLCAEPQSTVRSIMDFLAKPASDHEIISAIQSTSQDKLRAKYNNAKEISSRESSQFSIKLVPMIRSAVTGTHSYHLFEESKLRTSVMGMEV